MSGLSVAPEEIGGHGLLTGKVVVVTAAAGTGIGSATARRALLEGADVMVTEFVQSEALVRDNVKAWEMVDFTEGQRPMGVQIFGATPASMAAASSSSRGMPCRPASSRLPSNWLNWFVRPRS